MKRFHQINLQTRFPQHRARGTAPVYQARSTSHTFYPPAADSTPDQLPAPLFTLPPSPFTSHSLFTLSCENEAAAIYYTLDGSTPTAESTLYTAPFAPYQVGSVTIRAIAILEGFLDSDISEETVILIHPLSALDTLGSPIQPILHNDYYYLVFTQVGNNTLAVHKSLNIDYLLVGGGGGAGINSFGIGGAGAGGVVLKAAQNITACNEYSVTVGAPGEAIGGGRDGTNGGDTGISLPEGPIDIAIGGAGSDGTVASVAKSGGSGAGGSGYLSSTPYRGGAGITGQGNAGGDGYYSNSAATERHGGGGGGYNAPGSPGTSTVAGDGGEGFNLNAAWGLTNGIIGTIQVGAQELTVTGDYGWFAGGGGGCRGFVHLDKGYGKAGGTNGYEPAKDVIANCGSGAGGNSRHGGSGIAIIRWRKSA